MTGGGAFPVSDSTQVSAARHAAHRLAEELGFSETRAGQLALVVTELGTNLAKHAKDGELLLRGEAAPGCEAVEVIALDRGPGIRDVAASRRDGFSTSGTPGEGLGAVERQSDRLEIFSLPSGTAILACVLREPSPAREGPGHGHRLYAGAVRVAAPGEEVSGDDWAAHVRDERLVVMVVDGLGHGLAAHDAARAAHVAFERVHEQAPAPIVEAIHAALAGTRGAAVAVLAADLERGIARYSGLGNIAGVIQSSGSTARHRLVSLPGTAGVGRPQIREFQYPFAAEAMLVMHSDGISPQWDLAAYPGLLLKHPSLVAGVLFRDFARRRDDATAVVVKERQRA
jgi:anti-sigma regulatory factor (Ser/Thr protein kinase)